MGRSYQPREGSVGSGGRPGGGSSRSASVMPRDTEYAPLNHRCKSASRARSFAKGYVGESAATRTPVMGQVVSRRVDSSAKPGRDRHESGNVKLNSREFSSRCSIRSRAGSSPLSIAGPSRSAHSTTRAAEGLPRKRETTVSHPVVSRSSLLLKRYASIWTSSGLSVDPPPIRVYSCTSTNVGLATGAVSKPIAAAIDRTSVVFPAPSSPSISSTSPPRSSFPTAPPMSAVSASDRDVLTTSIVTANVTNAHAP